MTPSVDFLIHFLQKYHSQTDWPLFEQAYSLIKEKLTPSDKNDLLYLFLAPFLKYQRNLLTEKEHDFYEKNSIYLHFEVNSYLNTSNFWTFLEKEYGSSVFWEKKWKNKSLVHCVLDYMNNRNSRNSELNLYTHFFNCIDFTQIPFDYPIAYYQNSIPFLHFIFFTPQLDYLRQKIVTHKIPFASPELSHLYASDSDSTQIKLPCNHLLLHTCSPQLWNLFLEQKGDPFQLIQKNEEQPPQPLWLLLLEKYSSYSDQTNYSMLSKWIQQQPELKDTYFAIASRIYFQNIHIYSGSSLDSIKSNIRKDPEWFIYETEHKQTIAMLTIASHQSTYKLFQAKKYTSFLEKKDDQGCNVLDYLLASGKSNYTESLQFFIRQPQFWYSNSIQQEGLFTRIHKKNGFFNVATNLFPYKKTEDYFHTFFGHYNYHQKLATDLIQLYLPQKEYKKTLIPFILDFSDYLTDINYTHPTLQGACLIHLALLSKNQDHTFQELWEKLCTTAQLPPLSSELRSLVINKIGEDSFLKIESQSQKNILQKQLMFHSHVNCDAKKNKI